MFHLLSWLLLFFTHSVQAQKIFPENLSKEDSLVINAIAIYPESVRHTILSVCSYPGILIKMELLQEKTSSDFKTLLSGYTKEIQMNIWNLSRYPGLINKIAKNGKKNKDELKIIAKAYPSEIYNSIIESGRKDFEIIEKTNTLMQESEKVFENLIKDYPEKAKNNFKELVKNPEVLKILSDGIRTTVILGDAYDKDSVSLALILDSISMVHATENLKNKEDWEDGLKKNTEAKKEMEIAAKKFATDEGYEEDELIINDPQIVINYVYYPYPYWMGYPWWYEYPIWYVYPYWYDWGFYWTPTGVVYFGLPSSYFTYWYFDHQHHHYYYSHFTDYCLSHHYSHRKSNTEFNNGVRHWVKENERTLPTHFFDGDAKRADRIKELGKFTIEYNEITKKNPDLKLSKEEFLKNNNDVYPNLDAKSNETYKPSNNQKPVYYNYPKDTDPVYDQPSRTQPKINIPTKPEPVKPRVNPKPKFEQPKVTPRKKTGR